MQSKGINQRLKTVGFFLTISEWDRHLEVIRQILNGIEAFEPYAAYLRLSNGEGTPITASDVFDFMRSNGFEGDYMATSLIIKLFDTRFEGSLDFEDFLKMILSRDNPEIRFSVAQREVHEVQKGELLAPEIEYTLSRLFFKAGEFLSKIISDPETTSVINNSRLFDEITMGRSQILDFNNLKNYFTESKIRIRDEEIIGILRIVDINDDGRINKNEFGFFVNLFTGNDPSSMLLSSLKKTHSAQGQFNYFGEKANYNPGKYSRDSTSGFKHQNKGKIGKYSSKAEHDLRTTANPDRWRKDTKVTTSEFEVRKSKFLLLR